MKGFALLLGVGQGFLAAVWFHDVGISVIGSISIAIGVGYSWYLLVREP